MQGRDQACCGSGPGAQACATIAYAIGLAGAHPEVALTLDVVNPPNGADWTADTFPIALGNGVTIHAPGIHFTSIFVYAPCFMANQSLPGDVTTEVGLEGDPGNPIVLARDSKGQFTGYSTGAFVGGPVTLYVRDALSLGLLAGDGRGGGTLALGRDRAGVSGNVEVQANGDTGLNCSGAANAPATITDNGSTATHSLWLHPDPQGIYFNDAMFWIQPNCNVTLGAHPLFGSALDPVSGECVAKQGGDLIDINGLSNLQLSQATLQCSPSVTIRIEGSGSAGQADPSVLLDHSIVQDNVAGIYVGAGKLTCKDTHIVHNGQGIYQDAQDNGQSIVDLSSGGNQVTCNNTLGGDSFDISIAAGTTNLQNVAWDDWGIDAGSTEIWTLSNAGLECGGSETCPTDPTFPLVGHDLDLVWTSGQPLPDLTGGSAAADGCP